MEEEKVEERGDSQNSEHDKGDSALSNATKQCQPGPSHIRTDTEHDACQQKILNEKRRASIWETEAGVDTKSKLGIKAKTTQSLGDGERSILSEKRQISDRSLQRKSRRQSTRQSLSQLQRGDSVLSEKALIAERSQRRRDAREASATETQVLPNRRQENQQALDLVPYFPTPGTAERVLPTLSEYDSTSSLEYSRDTVDDLSRLPNNSFCWNLVTAFVVDDDDGNSDSQEEAKRQTKEQEEDIEVVDVFKSEIPYAEEVCKVTTDGQGMRQWKRYAVSVTIVALLVLAIAMTVTVVVMQQQSQPRSSDSSTISSKTQLDINLDDLSSDTNAGPESAPEAQLDNDLDNLSDSAATPESLPEAQFDNDSGSLSDPTVGPESVPDNELDGLSGPNVGPESVPDAATAAPTPSPLPKQIHATEPPSDPVQIINLTEPPPLDESINRASTGVVASPGK